MVVSSLLERLSRAARALGRLDGITLLLPHQELWAARLRTAEPGLRVGVV